MPIDYHLKRSTIESADLVIIMGTSLAVKPFNRLVASVPKNADLVLINRENTKASGFDFTKGKRKIFLKGDCDEIISQIVRDVGWNEEFEMLIER